MIKQKEERKNILFSRKQFTENYSMMVNWENEGAFVTLLSEIFTTQTWYDALNRPISIQHPDNTTVSYEYDKGGLSPVNLHHN